jgi:plastocyanin
MRRALGCAVAVAVVLVLAGCSGGAPKTVKVSITSSGFSPAEVSPRAGDTVVWTNNDTNPHTVTGPGFDSGGLNSKATYSLKLDKAGVVDYYCRYHPTETGRLVAR